MLDESSIRDSARCDIGRRSFLKAGVAIPAGLAWGRSSIAATRPAPAKSVILIWLWGGPSHIDTFDPKPEAPLEYRSPFPVISTREPGVQFSELLPKLAVRSNRFSVIRSHATWSANHMQAGTVGLTGHNTHLETSQPSFGAIVGQHKERRDSRPPFVMLGCGIPRDNQQRLSGCGGGHFGASAGPVVASCSSDGRIEIPSTQSPIQLASWNGTSSGESPATDDFSSLLSELPTESTATQDRFGRSRFGQNCLLARRLVEAGVPFIQVNWSQYAAGLAPDGEPGWDMHLYNFESLQDRHGPVFDKAFSALLDDLQDRGMLDSTLVVAMGEFGRTPRINARASRDDWHRCYFSLWSGGGVQPGRVIGASDRTAEEPVTPAISPLMVGTTIAELAGVDIHVRRELGVLRGGSVIRELL